MNTPKVLVVDDEVELREIIAFDLEGAGFEVLCAGDGVEAMKIINEQKPDAVVSDIRMPKMDGIELLETVRNLKKSPVMMFITGFSDVTLEEAYDLGADAMFFKPFDRRQLVSALKNHFLPQNKRWQGEKSSFKTQAIPLTKVFKKISEAINEKDLCLGRGGFFVSTDPSKYPIDSIISFKIEFSEDPSLALEGEAQVKWSRHKSVGPLKAGLGLEILRLTEGSLKSAPELFIKTPVKAFIPRG